MESSRSESTPSKSVSNNSKSSRTTSVPDISSFSQNSSNRSQIEDLRKRVEILKEQLAIRDRELTKEKVEKNEEQLEQRKAKGELGHLQVKSSALQSVCDELLEWMKVNEAEELKRSQELEKIFRDNLRELGETSKKLKEENSLLQQKLSKAETEFTTTINKNRYLKQDNSERLKEVEKLKAEFDKCCTSEDTLKCENVRLEKEIAALQKDISKKVDHKVQTLTQQTTHKMEKVRQIHNDREEEYGLTLTRLQNEIEFFKTELKRKTEKVKRLTEISDKLTIDNKKILDINTKIKSDFDEEKLKLRRRIGHLESQLESMSTEAITQRDRITRREKDLTRRTESEENTRLEIIAKEDEVEKLRSEIEKLKKQIVLLSRVESQSPGDSRSELKKKTILIVDLEDRVRQLMKECQAERELNKLGTGGAEFVHRTRRLLADRGPSSLQFIGDSIMKPSQLYLFAYNAIQVLGWGFILLRTISGLSEGLTWPQLYSTVELPVKIFQTAAVLEVFHSLFGIVRSPFGTTLMQVTSRVTLVWPILHLCKTASGSLGVPMLLVAWSVTEVIRYSFYALGLFNAVPFFLTYLRYTTFIVLYPLGVTGELLTLFSALPEVHERKIWTLEMPNAINMGISFWWILIFAALSYIPGFPQLYFYMFAQRKKIIGGVDSSASKNKKKQ